MLTYLIALVSLLATLASPEAFPPAAAGFSAGVVIPSYIDHLHFVKRQLSSFEVFCIDCNGATPILLVLSSPHETSQFGGSTGLQKLENVSVELISVQEAVHRVLPDADTSFLTELPRFKRNGKHLLQSIKKLYGCFALGTTWCFTTDSESFLVRPTSFQEITRRYFDKELYFTILCTLPAVVIFTKATFCLM